MKILEKLESEVKKPKVKKKKTRKKINPRRRKTEMIRRQNYDPTNKYIWLISTKLPNFKSLSHIQNREIVFVIIPQSIDSLSSLAIFPHIFR